MLKRFVGLIMIILGLLGLTVSVLGYIYGRQVIAQIGTGIDDSLSLVSETLDNVQETLVVTKDTIEEANNTLNTVETLAIDVSVAVDETRPLLDQAATITSQEIPDSLETIQGTIPTLVTVADSIDTTLGTLNKFQINESILGFNIQYDLGINYEPEVPFSEAVSEIGDSLDGLPESLRELDGTISTTNANLVIVSDDMVQVATDLGTLNEQLTEFLPVMDEYIRLSGEANDQIRQARSSINTNIDMLQLMVTIFMIWLGLFQFLPLYVGAELLSGQEMVRASDIETRVADRMAMAEVKQEDT